MQADWKTITSQGMQRNSSNHQKVRGMNASLASLEGVWFFRHLDFRLLLVLSKNKLICIFSHQICGNQYTVSDLQTSVRCGFTISIQTSFHGILLCIYYTWWFTFLKYTIIFALAVLPDKNALSPDSPRQHFSYFRFQFKCYLPSENTLINSKICLLFHRL